jgi:hypothetical protein
VGQRERIKKEEEGHAKREEDEGLIKGRITKKEEEG